MEDKLNWIFKSILKVTDNFKTANTQNTPTWDSLAHLNLILSLEEEFDIKVEPDEINHLYSDYNTIIQFIGKRQKHEQHVKA